MTEGQVLRLYVLRLATSYKCGWYLLTARCERAASPRQCCAHICTAVARVSMSSGSEYESISVRP